MTDKPHVSIFDVSAALVAGDRARAVGLAEAVLAAGAVDALSFSLRALKAEAEGRLDAALGDLRAACAADPGASLGHNALGVLASRMGRLAEAQAAFGRSVELEPGFAAVWRNLGLVQIALGDVSAGRTSLTTAAELTPADPEPRGHLAVLAGRRGDWEAVQFWGESAVTIDPTLSSAVRALADRDLWAGDAAAAQRRLEAWLARTPQDAPNRAQMTTALGRVHERLGRYPQAFSAFSDSAAQVRRAHAGRMREDRLIPTLQALRRRVEALPLRPRSEPPPTPCRHVFLMGFMRSGTTLIEQALAARDDVTTLEEQDALGAAVDAYLRPADGLARLAAASEIELEASRSDYWAQVKAFGAELKDRVFVDKLPFNGVKLALIPRLFPEARVVFSRRDPRDVVLSCYKHRFRVDSYTYQLLDLTSCANFYDAYMSLANAAIDRISTTVFIYRHEDLVDAFDRKLQEICDFLGLDWRDEMRDVGGRVREGLVSSSSAVQLRDGLSRDGLQGWRNYASELAPVAPILSPWVQSFGYEA